MGPHPAVAVVRRGVRRCLTGLAPGDLVLAACSGGADSLALAAALAFEAPRAGLRGGGVTVDHGLQDGSADQARRVTLALAELGLDPVRSVRATVARTAGAALPVGPDAADAALPGGPGAALPGGPDAALPGGPDAALPGGPDAAGTALPGGPGAARAAFPGGPEAAARAARYRALDTTAQAEGAAAILLGHTRDDQAETVLLGLARGSGARSLAGMPASAGRYLRPLLDVTREQTEAACAALGLQPWQDPQNSDPGYARVRVRHQALPALEQALGPGVAEALARSACQLRADADLLDSIAAAEGQRLAQDGPGMPADAVAALPPAIRTRVLRTAAIAAGSPAGALSWQHVAGLEALVTAWHGQRWVDLPGGIRGQRRCGRLLFTAETAANTEGTVHAENTEGAGGRD
jgi:tRNA(Ile)-lysidine synthase